MQGNLAEATTREGARGRDESQASQYSQDVEEEADEEADDEADEEVQEADTEAASQGEDSPGTPRPRATVQSVGSGKLTWYSSIWCNPTNVLQTRMAKKRTRLLLKAVESQMEPEARRRTTWTSLSRLRKEAAGRGWILQAAGW